MFNLFKPNEQKSASRKSFNRLQQLLIDAEQYANEGHADVSANLLRVLSNDASRMALSFDPPAKFDFEENPDAYVAYLERNIDALFEAGRQLRETVNDRKKPFDVKTLSVFEQSELLRELGGQMRENGCSEHKIAESALGRTVCIKPTFDYPYNDPNALTPNNPDAGISLEKVYDSETGKPTIKEWGNRSESWPNPSQNRIYREVDINSQRIESGECISDRGVDHCGRCTDHCEASDHRKTAKLKPPVPAPINERTLDLDMGAS